MNTTCNVQFGSATSNWTMNETNSIVPSLQMQVGTQHGLYLVEFGSYVLLNWHNCCVHKTHGVIGTAFGGRDPFRHATSGRATSADTTWISDAPSYHTLFEKRKWTRAVRIETVYPRKRTSSLSVPRLTPHYIYGRGNTVRIEQLSVFICFDNRTLGTIFNFVWTVRRKSNTFSATYSYLVFICSQTMANFIKSRLSNIFFIREWACQIFI